MGCLSLPFLSCLYASATLKGSEIRARTKGLAVAYRYRHSKIPPIYGILPYEYSSSRDETKGPFTYRRPSSNRRRCRPLRRARRWKVWRENRWMRVYLICCLLWFRACSDTTVPFRFPIKTTVSFRFENWKTEWLFSIITINRSIWDPWQQDGCYGENEQKFCKVVRSRCNQ